MRFQVLIFCLFLNFQHSLAPRTICSHSPSLHSHPSTAISSLCHSVTGSRFSGKDGITLVTVFNQMSLSFHAPVLLHASCCSCVSSFCIYLFIYLLACVIGVTFSVGTKARCGQSWLKPCLALNSQYRCSSGKVGGEKRGGERSNADMEDKRRKGGEKKRRRPLLV